jgi:hypothetical protein
MPGLWKAWKAKSRLPTLSTSPLGISPKSRRDSHIPTAPAAVFLTNPKGLRAALRAASVVHFYSALVVHFYSALDNSSPHPRIHFHLVHLLVSHKTHRACCVLELKCGGLLLDRHKAPLTRRFVVYYCSAVYKSAQSRK